MCLLHCLLDKSCGIIQPLGISQYFYCNKSGHFHAAPPQVTILPNKMADVAETNGSAPPQDPSQDALAIFDMSTKKKKKKPKKARQDDNITDGMASLSVSNRGNYDDTTRDEETATIAFFGAPPSFHGLKKRRKKIVAFDDELDDDDATGENGETRRRDTVARPWDGSDRDYTYQELISRAFEFLHGKNPALVGSVGVKKRVTLPLPQVAREGSKKTVFLNFGGVCQMIHRQQDHLLLYISAELGTTGNIQDGGRLVIKGRFNTEALAKVLKHYMMDYVVCASCRSADTVLMRDANTRLYFLQCESCGATRSVAQIRQGFRAQVESRRRRRT